MQINSEFLDNPALALSTVPLDSIIPYKLRARKQMEDHSEEPEKKIRKIMKKSFSFFQTQKPKKWYSVYRTEGGTIAIALESSVRKIEKLIYIFHNTKKNCVLIGKTGMTFGKRCGSYQKEINDEKNEKIIEKSGRQIFLEDIRKNPGHFQIGILYKLTEEEDLDDFESRFIQSKQKLHTLYNDNKGGGGGRVHGEESEMVYTVPNPATALITPTKYYPYKKDEEGHIRPQFTPGIKEFSKLEQNPSFYVIKSLGSPEKRYVGISINPVRRAREHGYHAEASDPENEKYDPHHNTGLLHPALAEYPENFFFGLLPVKRIEETTPTRLKQTIQLTGISAVESFLIEQKEALSTQNGFNSNKGGGGPISRKVTRSAKKIDF